MLETINGSRRRFLGTTAMTLAATQFGALASAKTWFGGGTAPGTPVRFRVLVEGRPPGNAHGVDVDEQGNGTVREQRMYQLIRQPSPISDRQFEIEFLDAGVEAFSFTFG